MCTAWLSSLPHLSSCRWARCWQQGSAGSLLLPLRVCLQPQAVKRSCAELLDVMGTQQMKFLLPFSQEVSFASLKSRGGRDVQLLTPGFSVEDLGACKQPCCCPVPCSSYSNASSWLFYNKLGRKAKCFFVYKLHTQHAVVKCTVSVWHLVLKSWHRSFAGCSDIPGSGGGRGSAAALSAARGGRSLPAAVSSCSSRPLLVPLTALQLLGLSQPRGRLWGGRASRGRSGSSCCAGSDG